MVGGPEVFTLHCRSLTGLSPLTVLGEGNCFPLSPYFLGQPIQGLMARNLKEKGKYRIPLYLPYYHRILNG
jgi:hypothetical protein